MERVLTLAIAMAVLVGSASVRGDAHTQGIAAAAPAASAEQPATEARLRAVFDARILPALRRAEGDPAALDGAVSAYLGWVREGLLLGLSEDAFAKEEAAARASLTTGLRNAYAKARARCPGVKPTRELIRFARMSMLVGWSEDDMLFPTFDDDVRACTPETTYRITVRTTHSDEKHGVTGESTYVAFLGAAPQGSEDELEGIGTYRSLVVSLPHETPNGKGSGCTAQGRQHRFTIRGTLEATGNFLDMSALGGTSGLTYVLGSTDWPLKPFFFDLKDAYAQTADEKDAVKGLATTARLDPVPLTGRVTTVKATRTGFGGECAGKTTETEEIRIERLGGTI